MLMLQAENIEVKNKKILVLGGGGAGRSTAVALKKAGAHVAMYQRTRADLLETCAEIGVAPADSAEEGGYDILINCTGVGMHDSEGGSPVTPKAFRNAQTAIDLIYEPKKSKFLQLAENEGLKIVNGSAMLFYQAYFADCLYLGTEPNLAQAIAFYAEYQTQRKQP